MKKNYAERDIMEMDNVGGYYRRHVSAITAEELHSKSDIAAELGHRDMVVAELLEVLTVTMEDIGFWLEQQKPALRNRIEAAIKKALGEDE